MASWIQKASSLIDTIDNQVTNQEKQKKKTKEEEQQQQIEEEPKEEEEQEEEEEEEEEEIIKKEEKEIVKEEEEEETKDYITLKKQYEGMVKLWNEERTNLKKAQQLLKNQKNMFNEQEKLLSIEHLNEINNKKEIINSLKKELLSHCEINEINNKLNNKIKDKQKEIELIRNEFEIERQNWEKERKTLSKNFERESFLENENVEYTNALVKTQSILDQKELQLIKIQNELKWIKKEKNTTNNTINKLKNENIELKNNINNFKQIIANKNKELIKLNDKNNKLQKEINEINKNINNINNENIILQNKNKNKQIIKLQERIKNLTNSVLQKQTEIDICISKKNEYKIKLDKFIKNDNDIEMGSTSLPLTLLRKKSIIKKSKNKISNLTSYKSINYGINVFDRIGLQFAHLLRHKPWMRLLIVFYIIILHLWCFIVLHFSINWSEDDQHH